MLSLKNLTDGNFLHVGSQSVSQLGQTVQLG